MRHAAVKWGSCLSQIYHAESSITRQTQCVDTSFTQQSRWQLIPRNPEHTSTSPSVGVASWSRDPERFSAVIATWVDSAGDTSYETLGLVQRRVVTVAC